jgi:hypothetical protein
VADIAATSATDAASHLERGSHSSVPPPDGMHHAASSPIDVQNRDWRVSLRWFSGAVLLGTYPARRGIVIFLPMIPVRCAVQELRLEYQAPARSTVRLEPGGLGAAVDLLGAEPGEGYAVDR